MRPAAVFALFALSLLPATALAQANQQAAAPPEPTSGRSARGLSGGSLTREQYVERAARRAAAQFERMDTNHNGVLDPAERQAWRSQHPRGARSRSNQAPSQ
jgi:hypothetical protein